MKKTTIYKNRRTNGRHLWDELPWNDPCDDEQEEDAEEALKRLKELKPGTFIEIIGCYYIAIKTTNGKWLVIEENKRNFQLLAGKTVSIKTRPDQKRNYPLRIEETGIDKINLLDQKQYSKLYIQN